LALRYENAVLRRQIARVRYQPADRIWLAALFRLISHGRWRQDFAVTLTTVLRWLQLCACPNTMRGLRLVGHLCSVCSRRLPGPSPAAGGL
jgi:hypothetical protein